MKAEDFGGAFEKHSVSFERNLGFREFVKRYAAGHEAGEGPFANAPELREDHWEWRRMLRGPGRAAPVPLLCCPEDVEKCTPPCCGPNEICQRCKVPVCRGCWLSLLMGQGIPMALCNDNFWGYPTDLIVRYQVRWIELAVVLPTWTNMIVWHIEGDYGHTMREPIARKAFRTAVRGYCYSFIMPWEDIVRNLEEVMSDAELAAPPWGPEHLRYLFRLHLKVGDCDMEQHLKEMEIRPFVPVLLLKELIDRRHGAFADNVHAQRLKERMERAVAERYPEQEPDVADEEKQGTIPPCILEDIRSERAKRTKASAPTMTFEKNATPGDGAREGAGCLEDLRPKAVHFDRDPTACTDPGSVGAGGVDRFGELSVQTGNKFTDQWKAEAFAQIMPFVIARMVSGPDYDRERRWRRTYEDAPFVDPHEFMRGFARRVEMQVRGDATAVPIVRSTWFRWQVEHMATALHHYTAHRGKPHGEVANELIAAMTRLHDKLWTGTIGQGKRKVYVADCRGKN